MSTYLIINEQHSLFDEQRELLREFGEVRFINISSNGITKKQMDSFEEDNYLRLDDTIIFASPIPYLLKKLASTTSTQLFKSLKYDVKVFHNDKRTKKELPNGKIIQVVAERGWEIL